MFYNNFIRLCTERGTTPTEVCHSICLASSAATKWNSGAIPRDTTLKKIADYFGVTPEYLLHGEDTPPQPSKPISLNLQLFAEDPPEQPVSDAEAFEARLREIARDLTEDDLKELENYANYLISRKGK